MALRVRCRCGKTLRISSALADRKLACPHCKYPFRIPAAKFKAAQAKAAAQARARQAERPPAPSAVKAATRRPQRAGSPEASPAAARAAARPGPIATRLDEDLLGGFPGEDDASRGGLLTELAAEESSASVAPSAIELHDAAQVVGADATSGGPTCPACNRVLAAGAKICVQCGINLQTGRSLMMTDDSRLDSAYVAAENTIRWVSWVIPLSFLPIASEAFGTRKPHAVRVLAVLTIITSVWLWCFDWSGSPKMQSYKNLLLWTGEAKPSAFYIHQFYAFTDYGDAPAFYAKLEALEAKAIEEAVEETEETTEEPEDAAEEAAEEDDDDGGDDDEVPSSAVAQLSWDELAEGVVLIDPDDDLTNAAHDALPPRQQCFGSYHSYQLLTNAFFHGDPIHLLGNLLFLMIFGARVNALIGNAATAVLYPILGVAASFIFLLSAVGNPPMPALGASGAIMGLAGIYVVLFPMHKVHTAAWFRWGLIRGFKLSLKIFALRGFWVVLFYIAFDVLYTVLGVETGTAHWAHLGGFMVGVVFGFALLLSRLVNARGGDILSALFGRHAWALIGKPRG